MKSLCYIILICTVCCATVFAGEMTFELPDSVKECFYEVIEKGTKCNLEYQVRKTFVFFCHKLLRLQARARLFCTATAHLLCPSWAKVSLSSKLLLVLSTLQFTSLVPGTPVDFVVDKS